MDDVQGERVLLAGQNLAIVLRDEGEAAVNKAVDELIASADGDHRAALVVLAAMVDVDRPTDAWWEAFAPTLEEEEFQRLTAAGVSSDAALTLCARFGSAA